MTMKCAMNAAKPEVNNYRKDVHVSETTVGAPPAPTQLYSKRAVDNKLPRSTYAHTVSTKIIRKCDIERKSNNFYEVSCGHVIVKR